MTIGEGSRTQRQSPAMNSSGTARSGSGRSACRVTSARQQSKLASLDLQREELGVDAALRKTAGDEPEPGLAGAGIHVAQLLRFTKAPDRTDSCGDILAKEFTHKVLLAFVAGRQHDEAGAE